MPNVMPTTNFHRFPKRKLLELEAMATDNCNIVASVIFLIIIYLGLFGKGSDELENGGLFIFGDSLVDAGNNNYLATLSKANVRPNGIDFKASGGTPTGRFTNGRTILDIVGRPSYKQLIFAFLLHLIFL